MAKTDLTFWSWRQEDKAFYQDVIKKFQEKEPEITVKFETYAPENYQTILSTALAAGRGPDVIQVRAYGNLETIATRRAICWRSTSRTCRSSRIPGGGAGGRDPALGRQGLCRALRHADQLIVYNKKIFADNGVKAPQTWDELMAVARR